MSVYAGPPHKFAPKHVFDNPKVVQGKVRARCGAVFQPTRAIRNRENPLRPIAVKGWVESKETPKDYDICKACNVTRRGRKR